MRPDRRWPRRHVTLLVIVTSVALWTAIILAARALYVLLGVGEGT